MVKILCKTFANTYKITGFLIHIQETGGFSYILVIFAIEMYLWRN